MERWTSTRWVEMHDWPAWLKPATLIFAAAVFQSPLGSMITGALLPSSRPDLLAGGAASGCPSPTSGEPVKVIIAMSGWSTMALPTDAPAAGHHVDPARRQAALLHEQLDQRDRRERRLAGRLLHDRAAGGDGGGQLVGHQVQREVERRDGADDADGQPQREAELAVARLRGVHRDHLAGHRPRLGRRELERQHRTGRLDAGGRDGLGRLLARWCGRSPPAARAARTAAASRISTRFQRGRPSSIAARRRLHRPVHMALVALRAPGRAARRRRATAPRSTRRW